MRTLMVCGVLLGGCFDEGGDTARVEAAHTVVDSLYAFAEIQANLTTDPAAAGAALTEFVKTPIAANNLIAPPFDLEDADLASARIAAAPIGLPDCIDTMGPTGCDSIQTNATCEAGNFTFTGTASRTCSPCANVTGACTYDWNLDLGFKTSKLGLQMNTQGPITVSPASITADTKFDFTLTSGKTTTAGILRVCSCGPITIKDLPPRRAINSSFVVKDFGTGKKQRCARVEFDGAGVPTSVQACTCADKTTCL